MASGKGCRPSADGKYWLHVVQEVVKNFPYRASIHTNNSLRFFLKENPVIIHVAVVVVTFFDELAVAVHVYVEVLV